jgi:neutral ceramidase
MNALQFGTAVRDITPHHPVWAHGYASRTRPSSGVREPLSLSCLAINNGDIRILMFALDMIGVQAEVCNELYELLEKETGVAYPNIMISGSHTHFASAVHGTTSGDPECAFVDSDPVYVEAFKKWMVEAAKEALENLRPMRLEVARIRAPQVVFNRRTVCKSDGMVEMNLLYPEDSTAYTFSPVDDELTVHRLVDDGGVQAVLLNFGCHPVTGCSPEEDYYRFSADYPYYARQTIAEAWHCPVFFTLGAAGDAVPINRRGDCRERFGSILGHTTVLAERTFQNDSSMTLAADVVQIEAETIIKTDPEMAEREYEAARQAVLAVEDKKGDAYRELLETFRHKMMVCSRARQYPENKAQHNVQFIQIGETVFVSLPFEVLAEIGLKMKERFPNSVMVSCCGGYQGYLPLAHEYDRVGYEATESSTHFVPGTADRILDLILDRLKRGV